jgi:hypothetical protein
MNLPLASQWMLEHACCSKCKKGQLRVISEINNGFASTITWKCGYCGIQSTLQTSPKQHQQFEVNTRMVQL